MRRTTPLLVLALAAFACAAVGHAAEPPGALTPIQRLGEALFFDARLSVPPGQACGSCHDPLTGFADPDPSEPTSEGAVTSRFGRRNAQTASYAAFIPPLRKLPAAAHGHAAAAHGSGHDHAAHRPHQSVELDVIVGGWTGGLFWDGRAGSLEDQAKAPFLDPLEMHNPDKAAVVEKVRHAAYAPLFRSVFGPDALADVATAYDNIARAIAEFERAPRFAPFTSKYDDFARGAVVLSAAEARGLTLFEGPAKCFRCHPTRALPSSGRDARTTGASAGDRRGAMFTTFRYENLGLPRNPANPFYALPASLNPDGARSVDLGLGPVVKDPMENGKFRIPSLRNVAVTPPYEHNGLFKTLHEVLHFLDTRDVAAWPPAEVPETVHRHVGPMPADGRVLGNLKLTEQDIDDIVAFLHTLTDRAQLSGTTE